MNNKIWFYSVNDIVISVLVDHEQFLHLKISSGLFPTNICLYIVYAKCNRVMRRDLWERLLECQPFDGCPWVVGGDFNIIANPMEHSLGVVNHPGGMQEFADFIVTAGLADAGFIGSRFTKTNRRIWKRLDRISAPFMPKPRGSLRLQNMWFLHSGFMQAVILNWNNPCSQRRLVRLVIKLKRLKNHLKWWNQKVFGNIHDNLKALDLAASIAEERYNLIHSEENRVALSLAQENLSQCLSMEEAFWKQKASSNGLLRGEEH
ncbi:uncharacterized protein [Henckelia pumila]|uniref:uncharacterized protein n=1 Tax=Henckelia pumila TaxID=405737 RepID=UPI003C6E86FC